jgi:lysophospholipid acyltransferase (LPLAT)-like uncharacterized protein
MDEPTERKLSWQQRLMLRVVPSFVAALLRLLDRTLRYESVIEQGGRPDLFSRQADPGEPSQPGQPALWCFWHRCLLTAACYFHDRPRTTLLISASFDGELIARTIERLGYQTVRGSSSRYGTSGLRSLARVVRAGATAVIPADGPRGPRYALKPGITRLSRLCGLPVCSFYLLPQHAWVLRSWDALLIPRPFSRVVIVWGRPVPAPAAEDEEEPARVAAEATLERLRALAEGHFASPPSASQ